MPLGMFTLDQVLPWGRSFDEYQRMFALTEDDLDRRILGCGDGPASFNAEATLRGHRVVSCDPIYRFGRSQIQERIAATYDEVLLRRDSTRMNSSGETVFGTWRSSARFGWHSALEIYGATPSAELLKALSEYGLTEISAFPDGFRASTADGRPAGSPNDS